MTCRWRNAEPFAAAAAVSKAVSGRAVGARPSTQTMYSLSPVAVWPNGDPRNGVIVSSVQIPAVSGRLRTELVIEARAIPWEQARLYIT